ncbi:unnamed protein product [Didymodactylos carnosus]|uniref:Nitronate monooxygenase domain-containing protein n=1 Tax=Didymodactylos carnosus TaxID=1234261 RepID=A0A8S2DCP4_9BILA|nr:unnamed protein product [Didymodactylos carnosus]CAF3704439.1 unnamed protein product [Didymodactylos carnosus]
MDNVLKSQMLSGVHIKESKLLPKTLFTKLLNIQYPIIQAPMSPLTTPELVANVSNAGGLGSIAAARMNRQQLKAEIDKVRLLTSKPFAINLFIPPSTPDTCTQDDVRVVKEVLNRILTRMNVTSIDMNKLKLINPPVNLYDEQIDVILQERISVLSFTFGYPSSDIISKCKKLRIKLVGTATTPRECLRLTEIGCDAICLQGSEAGGHRGSFLTKDKDTIEQSSIGLASLLSQCAQQSPPVPLIAAGGIMDAHGLISCLVLGASAIQMGTKFLTSDESTLIPSAHKQLLLDPSKIETTVLTRIYTGKPARGIYTQLIDEFKTMDPKHILPWNIQSQLALEISRYAAKHHQLDFMQLWAGQNYSKCEKKPAKQIVEDIIQEANKILNGN